MAKNGIGTVDRECSGGCGRRGSVRADQAAPFLCRRCRAVLRQRLEDKRREARPGCVECGGRVDGRRGRLVCSDRCARARVNRRRRGQHVPGSSVRRSSPLRIVDCAGCGAAFVQRFGRLWCGDRCRPARLPCKACGGAIGPGRKGRRTCSDGCARELYLASRRRYKRRRRASRRGVELERFDDRDVFERDGWRCHLCGRSCLRRSGTWEHPRGATVDHVIPLAAGGAHSLANVRTAHWTCNIRKGARSLGPEQLRLVG